MNFSQLTERISPKLKAIAYKLDGRFTFLNEEDLYQEALLFLWQKFQSQDLLDKTDSFIVQGCFFHLKNYIRKVYKRVDINSVSLNELINGQEDNTIENILFLENRNKDKNSDSLRTNLLMENIKEYLNERERVILSLSLDNLTTRQIGERLGFSHVMVVKIKNKIREKLKRFKEEP